MPHDHPEFVVGERIPGTKYVLCGVLGKGGMGAVYEVVKEPGIRGAMKVMYPAMATRPDCLARFFDEVRLLATLKHRNIVTVHDYDLLEGGTPFLVMEKLEGETLRSTLRKSVLSTQGFPARGAYEVIRQTCEGLYRAHTQPSPIVHRDIKPENLFLNQVPGSDEVEVKVLDFGVAALVGGGGARGQFGTPKYMAPEQFRGEAVTPKADLYAAALVLYEMLTGRLPWDAERDSDVYQAHAFVDPLPPSRFAPWVPKSVDALMHRALATDPARRPHSVFAFASQLYELQWVDDGHSRPVDVNTTAPTLTALVSARDEERREGPLVGTARDTFRGMSLPPVEGGSLEVIAYDDTRLPRDTIPDAPSPSPSSSGPGSGGPVSRPLDRKLRALSYPLAPTGERLPAPRRAPTHDTEPLSPTVPPRPAAAPLPSPAPAVPAPVSSTPRPETTPLTAAVSSTTGPGLARARRVQYHQRLPFVVFFSIVTVGTGLSIVATRRPSRWAVNRSIAAAAMQGSLTSAPASAPGLASPRPVATTEPTAAWDLDASAAATVDAARAAEVLDASRAPAQTESPNAAAKTRAAGIGRRP